jgi:Protein of unknown function (DUF3467)
MASDQGHHSGGGSGGEKPRDPNTFSQEVQYSQISARVPEKVARGAFTTGALVLQGPHEFVLDFVLRMTQPQLVAARVILPITMMPSVIHAIEENLKGYTSRFGPPPALPVPQPPPTPPSLEEIYDQLKLPDDHLSGSYANAMMITHTPAEFCLDFITNIYPRSAVSARVYLAAAQIPGLLNTLQRAFQQYQQKTGGQPPRNA